jgi:hypothetical protein
MSNLTPAGKMPRFHSCKSNGEAASIISAASHAIRQYKASTTDAERINELLSAMKPEDAKKMRNALSLNTSPDDARIRVWEAVQRLQLAAVKRIERFTIEDAAKWEVTEMELALDYAVRLNKDFPLPSLEGEKRA